jgi:hypothetical protein
MEGNQQSKRDIIPPQREKGDRYLFYQGKNEKRYLSPFS